MFPISSFYIQAEDGIRDVAVTGVQTCALPIFLMYLEAHLEGVTQRDRRESGQQVGMLRLVPVRRKLVGSTHHQRVRSEERRVGKECRSRWSSRLLSTNHSFETLRARREQSRLL